MAAWCRTPIETIANAATAAATAIASDGMSHAGQRDVDGCSPAAILASRWSIGGGGSGAGAGLRARSCSSEIIGHERAS